MKFHLFTKESRRLNGNVRLGKECEADICQPLEQAKEPVTQ